MLWPQLGYFFVQQIMRALEYRGFLLAFAVQISVGENQPLDAFRIRRFGNANGLDQIRIGQILRIVLQIGFGKRLLDFTPRHALGNADAPLRDLSLGQAREQFAQCRFAVKLVFTDFVIARTAGQCGQQFHLKRTEFATIGLRNFGQLIVGRLRSFTALQINALRLGHRWRDGRRQAHVRPDRKNQQQ